MERKFSFSKILNYATCPMLHYYRDVVHVFPGRKAKALSLGNCMSEALRKYRSTGSLEEASDGFKAAWISDGKILRVESDPEDPKDFRTVRRALEILEEYVIEYPDDPDNVVRPEVSFEIKAGTVRGYDIILNGRIDGVMLSTQKRPQIIEDKTTTRLGPSFFVQLGGSLQIGLYLWAANEYGLFEIGGKRTTPTCLMSAVRIHPKESKFMRDVAIKSRDTLNGFKDNALKWIDRMIASEEESIYPLNDIDNSICIKYGGCDYALLKYVSSKVKKTLLKNEFIIKTKEDNRVSVDEKGEKKIIKGKYVTKPITDETVLPLL